MMVTVCHRSGVNALDSSEKRWLMAQVVVRRIELCLGAMERRSEGRAPTPPPSPSALFRALSMSCNAVNRCSTDGSLRLRNVLSPPVFFFFGVEAASALGGPANMLGSSPVRSTGVTRRDRVRVKDWRKEPPCGSPNASMPSSNAPPMAFPGASLCACSARTSSCSRHT